jgi:chromatin remodeling complex protein RSC6
MPEKKAKGGRSNSQFMAPVQPDDALAKVVGSTPLPRTEITKKLWDYIKSHNLQDPNNKRTIRADDKLRPIFDGKSEVSMFEMTKLVNGHIRK